MVTTNALGLSDQGVAYFNGTGQFSAPTMTNNGYVYGSTLNNIKCSGAATNGQLPIGSSGTTPVVSTLTAGSGISIANGAGSITISTSNGNTWVDQGTSTTLSAANYFATAAVTLTMPAAPSQGDTVRVIVDTASTVVLTANTGQVIRLSSAVTSTAGTMTNSARGDSVVLVYRTTGAAWIASSFVGSFTPA